jgi:diaphanous 1
MIMQSIHNLAAGLEQVKKEVLECQQLCTLPTDQFIHIMQVYHLRLALITALIFYVALQPFLAQVSGSVDALKKMGISVDSELRSLLVYYGETPDSPEASKPEDFFSLILTFSSSLQVCSFLLSFFGSSSVPIYLFLPEICSRGS